MMWTIRELRSRWAEIVGPEWAQTTYPSCIVAGKSMLMVSTDLERVSEWRTVLCASRCLEELPEVIGGHHVERVHFFDRLVFCRESCRS